MGVETLDLSQFPLVSVLPKNQNIFIQLSVYAKTFRNTKRGVEPVTGDIYYDLPRPRKYRSNVPYP